MFNAYILVVIFSSNSNTVDRAFKHQGIIISKHDQSSYNKRESEGGFCYLALESKVLLCDTFFSDICVVNKIVGLK